MLRKISPCLWFDSRAEEAARFYVSVFRDSKITATTHYPEAGQEVHGQPAGSVLTVEFELEGNAFTALNGGPLFQFTEAVSFQVECADQTEIDYFWNALSDGGETSQCGWLKDRFGLSWQVVPHGMVEMLTSNDRVASTRAFRAIMEMTKLDLAALQQAFDGK